MAKAEKGTLVSLLKTRITSVFIKQALLATPEAVITLAHKHGSSGALAPVGTGGEKNKDRGAVQQNAGRRWVVLLLTCHAGGNLVSN
jgi:hypothetical protein